MAEWIDGPGGQTSCASYADPDPDETTLHVRLRCDALGPVTFRVEGVSPRGTLCDAECTIQVNSCVDLDVDSNNDHVIDPVNGPGGSDDPIEAADPLPQTPGKWFWRNNDDSDGNGRMDNGAAPEHALDADAINGANDLMDLPPLIVRGLPASGYPEGSKLFLETQDANAVRVFGCRTADCAQVWLGPGLPARVEIPIDPLDRTFALEGVQDAKTLLLHLVLEDALGLEICRDTLRVTVLHLDAQWEREPNEDITDPNDHPTGTIGYRAFPDATAPNGNWNDVVRVRVIVVPRAMNVPVHLGAFDPDDPSADADVVDNDLLGGDNRDNGHTDTGELQSVLIVTDGAGTARTQFRLAHQPGDNHRVAATLKQAALSVPSNNNVPPSGQTAGNKNDGQVELFIGTLTPMLTVWRKLEIETDSMATPDSTNTVTGTILSLISYDTNTQRAVLEIPDLPDDFEANKQHYVGRIDIQDFGSFLTIDTTSKIGADRIKIANAPTNIANAIGKEFTLWDDDKGSDAQFIMAGFDKPPVSLPKIPDVSLAISPFKEAYVDVRPLNTSLYDIAAFKRNIVLGDVSPITESVANLSSEPNYWVAHVVSAFQGYREKDGDPDTESENPGLQFGLTREYGLMSINSSGSLVFLETIREFSRGDSVHMVQMEQYTVIHEIGHQFLLQHEDGRWPDEDDTNPSGDFIMTDYTGETGMPANMSFGPKCLKKIRQIPYPPQP